MYNVGFQSTFLELSLAHSIPNIFFFKFELSFQISECPSRVNTADDDILDIFFFIQIFDFTT